METKQILESIKTIAEYLIEDEERDYQENKHEIPLKHHIVKDVRKVLAYANKRLKSYEGTEGLKQNNNLKRS